jgi:hypothetical protein
MARAGRGQGAELSANTQQSLAIADLLMTAVESPDHELQRGAFSSETAKKGKRRRLSTIKTMDDAFSQFDMNNDDTLDRREQILMYRTLMNSLQTTLDELVKMSIYNAAIELRDRIVVLRKSFEKMQIDMEFGRQANERKAFQQAEVIVKKKCSQFWSEEKQKLEIQHGESKQDLKISHAVQRGQLEEEMDHMPQPLIKFSSTLLAMRKTERALCAHKRFEEAKEVKRRADRMEIVERKRFDEKCARKQQGRRNNLVKTQDIETRKRHEQTKRNEWGMHRATELDKKVTKWRMKHNHQDMHHMHVMDGKRKPDFSIKPVLPQRPGARHTGATNKGSIMLSKVASGRQAVAGLCALHNFDGPKMSGTTQYAWGQ